MRSRSSSETFGESKYFLLGQMRSEVPVFFSPDAADLLQLLRHLAVGERDLVHAAVALDLDFELLGERVGDRDADAVQAAGELVGGVGVGARELRAGVELGHHQLDRRDLLLGMQADRDAAAVVGDGDRSVRVDGDLDLVGVPAERFVGGVVDRFLDDVGGVGSPGIHSREPLDGLDAPEFLD